MSARRELEKEGIPATICPLKTQCHSPAEERKYAVFVRSPNEPTTRALLDESLR
ncbi:MAG: hypothetical protein KIS67_17300 [Verrucomicrobiae bacterium]|nr:hypothetical protein [Verrucomicrobiae bacterium]